MERAPKHLMEQRHVFPEQRKYPRYPVTIPASVKIITSAATLPFEIKDVMIRDVGEAGLGLSLTVVTMATTEDMAKIFTRRRVCNVFCKLPGSNHTTCLFGTIAWTEPRRTSDGLTLRFGVSLEGCDHRELEAVKAFLASKDKQPASE